MNRLSELIRTIMADSDMQPPPTSSRSRGKKRGVRIENKETPPRRHQTHFYDPNAPEVAELSSNELGLAELDRHQIDTLNRIEDTEAALAKERKRAEQLEFRRKEIEAREEQRRMQKDEDAGRSPREKNRRAFEREVARVERNAQRKVEGLERRFAHSDKVFEWNMARQDMEADEQGEQGAAENPRNVSVEQPGAGDNAAEQGPSKAWR